MNTRKPVVLLSPLDWGLGHTIRCIPIIDELWKRNCEVLVACNPKQKDVLSLELPSLDFIDLAGYDISYGSTRVATLIGLVHQTPSILMAIQREQIWLRKFLKKNAVDAIISDNRYGLYSELVPSVLITHQLGIKSGLGRIVDLAIQKRLYTFINKFSSCWVPDSPDETINAAGELSHPARLPETVVEYIGCLSRLKKGVGDSGENELLIILSGPEPQRTILEDILLKELQTFQGSCVFVRGIVSGNPIPDFNDIRIINYAQASELSNLMSNSEVVICRSGYTSVMDLLALGKRAILVPTPGQAEQEYLAEYLHQKNLAVMAKQTGFCLRSALDSLKRSAINMLSVSSDNYKTSVGNLVDSLSIEEYS